MLKAVADRETTIKRLEAELRKEEEKPSGKKLPDLPSRVGEQLKDLAGLLKSEPAKVKSEFRRLNLQLTFHPTEAELGPITLSKASATWAHWSFSICVRGARVRFWALRGGIRPTAAPQFHWGFRLGYRRWGRPGGGGSGGGCEKGADSAANARQTIRHRSNRSTTIIARRYVAAALANLGSHRCCFGPGFLRV
jgi:hypothetical protein